MAELLRDSEFEDDSTDNEEIAFDDNEDDDDDDNEDNEEDASDDDEEVRGDDEEDGSNNEEDGSDDDENMNDIDDVLVENVRDPEVRDNDAGRNEMEIVEDVNGENEAMNIDIIEGQGREAQQETLFKGVNTEGMRVPLQPNQDIRAIDHLLLILSRAVRHCNTYEQVIDELLWLKKSYRFINVPTTKAALWKTLGRNKENLFYQIFCSKCKDQIGVGEVVDRVCHCGSCGPDLDNSDIATFVHIRLTPQIQDLLKIPNIAESLRYRNRRVKVNENSIEDIYDGHKYQELRNPGNFLSNENNFSLSLWTDGLKLTKSSPATTYPVILQLNELSPHSRKQHMFLAGLWVANNHPPMNSILRPICNELRDLYLHGIPWRPNGGAEVISKFITTIFIADSVAKPDVLRMKKFNGRFGCTYCLARGEMVENTWVYRAEAHHLRSNESIRNDGIRALAQRRIVNGVKGVSALVRLPEFDLVDNVPVDCSHNTYLGVAKRLVIRWLTDANEDWYIGNSDSTAAIDTKLLTIKPPTRISRTPRSILLYKMWKASEWRNWLFYYALPCLDGILPIRYLSHFEKLVKAVYTLNSFSISERDLNTSENLILIFVEDYQRHYGLRNMVFNVHLLTHLVNSVRKWGPLWAFSALPFESMNRKISDSITSPYRRADQVVTRFFMKKFVIVAARQIPVADVTRTETSRILKISNVHVEGMREAHNFIGLGRRITRHPQDEEINLVTAAGLVINPERDIELFKRACIYGTEYRIYDNRRRKFCNHIVFCSESRFFVIEKILSYFYRGQLVAGIIGKLLQSNGNAYRVPHMQRLVELEDKHFIRFNEIRSPALMIPIAENLAAVPLSNVWETD